MRTKPCLHCLPKGNTNRSLVDQHEPFAGNNMRDQHNSSINGEGKTSAVRPRKQPYNPRSGSSKADRQAPAAFSFRGLDIRHRLPDAKRSRELLRASGDAHLSIGVSTPQNGAYPFHIHHRSYPMPMAIAVHGRGLLPRCDCCAFFASYHSGLFLPQRDPENHVRGRARIRKPDLG